MMSTMKIVLVIVVVTLLAVVGLLRGGFLGGIPDDDVTLPQTFLDSKIFPFHLNGKHLCLLCIVLCYVLCVQYIIVIMLKAYTLMSKLYYSTVGGTYRHGNRHSAA